MIPKIIHYCWLSGDPYPAHIQACIDSWKQRLPGYTFMLWDRDRFPRGKSIWVDQAFDNKKYAFAADYIRFYALYNYGGIYLDCDVEVIKSFDPFLSLDTLICWQNEAPGLEVAAFGATPRSPWVQSCLEHYDNRPFILSDGGFDMAVLPEVVERILRENAYQFVNVGSIPEAESIETDNRLPVFPHDYFSPKSYFTKEVDLSANSVCIHHFDGSWKKKLWFEKADDVFVGLFHIKAIRPFEGIIRRCRILFKKHQ